MWSDFFMFSKRESKNIPWQSAREPKTQANHFLPCSNCKAVPSYCITRSWRQLNSSASEILLRSVRAPEKLRGTHYPELWQRWTRTVSVEHTQEPQTNKTKGRCLENRRHRKVRRPPRLHHHLSAARTSASSRLVRIARRSAPNEEGPLTITVFGVPAPHMIGTIVRSKGGARSRTGGRHS